MPDIVNAEASTAKNPVMQVVKPGYHTIPDNPFDSQNPERINQQQVLPNAIQDRLIGSIISSSAAGLGQATFLSATIPNGITTTFNFKLSDNQGRTIIAFPDTAVFIGGGITNTNQWPSAFFGPSNFPIFVNPGNWGLTDNVNSVTTVVCRNQSGADQPVVVACRWRVITQPLTKFTNLNN